MLSAEQWAKKREALTAWWRGERETPLLQVHSVKAGVTDMQWFNVWAWLLEREHPERVIEQFEYWAERAYFGGAAFPNLWSNLGPGSLAAYYTGFLEFNPLSQTAWFEHPLEWDAITRLQLREDSAWWQYNQRIARLAAAGAQASGGQYIVGTTDIGGVLDVLASLRGTQELLFDLLYEPERVEAACRMIEDDFIRVYDTLDAIRAQVQEGTSAWMGIWCPGRHYPLQCDFSAMISPAMFERFVLPSLQKHCRWLDHSIYHLDGPNEIPHLDLLLSIPELDAIQWVPGSGIAQCESPQWFDLYRKILGAGKRLVLQTFNNVTKIPAMLEQIPQQGVLLTTWTASEADAHALEEAVGAVTTVNR